MKGGGQTGRVKGEGWDGVDLTWTGGRLDQTWIRDGKGGDDKNKRDARESMSSARIER